MKCDQRIDHSSHGDEGEEGGRDPADTITKIEQADGEAAQDDGEVKP